MRVKRGTIRASKRKNLLKTTKGYRWGRKNKVKHANEARIHAGVNAYRGRKEKKRLFRQLHTIKINAGARTAGITYSRLIDALKKAKSPLNRKALSQLAEQYPKAFAALIAALKK